MHEIIIISYILIGLVVILNKYKLGKKLSIITIGIIIGLILGFITLLYQPNASEDFYRISEWIDALRKEDYDSPILLKNAHIKILWLQYIYLNFFAYFFSNNNWACVITIFFEILLCFAVYDKTQKKTKTKVCAYMGGVLIFMGTWDYYMAASNLRYLLAGAVFMYIAYLDLVEKRNTLVCFIGYISLCFFHPGMSIPFVLRLIIMFPKNDMVTFIACTVLLLQRQLLESVGKMFEMLPEGIGIISSMEYKYTTTMYKYMNGDVQFARMAIKVPLALCCASIVISFYVFYRKKYFYFKNYILFVILLMAMSLGGLYDYDLFNRHAMIAYMFFVPFYCIIRKDKFAETSFLRHFIIEGVLRVTEIVCLSHAIYLLKIQYFHFNMPL